MTTFFLIIDIPIALPGILVVDQPWISGIGGGSIPGTKTQFIVNPCFYKLDYYGVFVGVLNVN